MGHMTRQCKNHLSAYYQRRTEDGEEGKSEMTLPLVHEDSDISSLSSSSASDLDDRQRQQPSQRRREKKQEVRHRCHKREAEQRGRSHKKYMRLKATALSPVLCVTCLLGVNGITRRRARDVAVMDQVIITESENAIGVRWPVTSHLPRYNQTRQKNSST